MQQIKKDLLILSAIATFTGKKLSDIIQDYDPVSMDALFERNFTKENIQSLYDGLANEAYGRLKKKFKPKVLSGKSQDNT